MKTLGDHLRKRRLDLRLLQRDVAQRLQVDQMTVCNWETNRTSPQLGFIPRIIAFLGYDPYDTLEGSLGQQILAYRAGRGLTQRDLAGTLAVDPGTVRGWEKGQHLPLQKKALRLGALVVGPAHSEANSSP